MKAHTQTQPYATLCVVQVEAGVSQGTDPNGTATRPDYSKLREKSGLPVLYKVLLGHSHIHLHAMYHCLCAPVGELRSHNTVHRALDIC